MLPSLSSILLAPTSPILLEVAVPDWIMFIITLGLIGLSLYFAIKGCLTGVVQTSRGSFRRDTQWVSFYTFVSMFFTLAFLLMVAVGAKLYQYLHPYTP